MDLSKLQQASAMSANLEAMLRPAAPPDRDQIVRSLQEIMDTLAKIRDDIGQDLTKAILASVETGAPLRLAPAAHAGLITSMRSRGLKMRLGDFGVRIEHEAGHPADDYERAQALCMSLG